MNSHAIGSLILGVLSIMLPVLGIVLGIVGLIFSRKAVKIIQESGEDGSALAMAGLITSIVGIGLQVLSVIVVIAIFLLALSHFSFGP